MIARRNRIQMRAFTTATEERLPSGTPADSMLEQYRITARPCTRVFALFFGLGLFVLPVAAEASLDNKYPESPTTEVNAPSKTERLGRLPIEWIIGPYIPVQGQLETLSNAQRGQIYVRQTFLTAGSYVARAFSAGLDQARGEPSDWGGGFDGYGKRYAARYGEFVIQNSILSGRNALLGYEPRYDFCRCDGFWPRTRHAISRNFVAYNRSERNLRPQIPLYGGAFAAGVVLQTLPPGQNRNIRKGVHNMCFYVRRGTGHQF